MPIAQDSQNIVEVISLSNLGNLTAPNPTVVIPPGLETFYISTVKNNLTTNIQLAPDVQQLVKTVISTNQATIIPGQV
jgi:hypothetical protein